MKNHPSSSPYRYRFSKGPNPSGTEPRLSSSSVSTHSISWAYWKQQLFQRQPWINTLVLGGVLVGFLHGWLKFKIRNSATTFVFDAILLAALGLVLIGMPKKNPWFPEGPLPRALMGFYALNGVYLLLPIGPPILIGIASLRGWCFSTWMFLLGYHLTRSRQQVLGQLHFLLLLGVGTSLYGLTQSAEEARAMMEADPFYALRLQDPFFHTSKGSELRIFSTFVSPGAFGGTLSILCLIGISLLSSKDCSPRARLFYLLVLIPILLAMLKTGSRSALLSLLAGFVVIVLYRRNPMPVLLATLALGLAFLLTASSTGGLSVERFKTIFDVDTVFYRNSIPISIGWDFMMENPIGGGIGRSGYSIPFSLKNRFQYDEFVGCDGDMGRLMIDFGWLGLLALGRVFLAAGQLTWSSLQRLRDSQDAAVGLSCATAVIVMLISFPSGSPFLGIPMGAMTWFLLGALQSLQEIAPTHSSTA